MTDYNDQIRFPLLSDEAGGSETAYDTHRLNSLHDAAEVVTTQGDEVAQAYRGGGAISGAGVTERRSPLISAAEWSVFHIIPIKVTQDMMEIEISHDCIIGLATEAIIADVQSLKAQVGIEFQYFLASDPSRKITTTYLPEDDGTRWVPQTTETTLDVSRAAAGDDVLVCAFRSQIPESYYASEYITDSQGVTGPDGLIDGRYLDEITSKSWLVACDSTFFSQSGHVAGELGALDLNVTCPFLMRPLSSGGGTTFVDLKPLNWVQRYNANLAGSHPPVEELDQGDAGGWDYIMMAYVPWVQIRSTSLRFTHSTLTYPDRALHDSGKVASAQGYRGIRRALDEVVRRPSLKQIGHPGYYPPAGEDRTWWTAHGYQRHWAIVGSKDAVQLPLTGTPPYGSDRGSWVVRMLVAGVWMQPINPLSGAGLPVYEEWEGARTQGVRNMVLFGDEPISIEFARRGVSASRLLTSSISYPDTADLINPDLLSLEGDWGVWQTVEVAVDDLSSFSIQVEGDPEFADLRWIDEIGTENLISGQKNIAPQLKMYVLGYALYWQE